MRWVNWDAEVQLLTRTTWQVSQASCQCIVYQYGHTSLSWYELVSQALNEIDPPPLPIPPHFFSPFLFFEKFLIVFCITETYIHMHAYMQTRLYMHCKHARTHSHTHRFMKTFVKTEFIFYVHSHRPICVYILFHSWYPSIILFVQFSEMS